MSSELEEFIGFASRVIVFRDGAPFDAFDGRNLDPKSILEAMFGQTDGSGLNNGYGRAPDVAGASRATDGVRVKVEVPAEIRAGMRDRRLAAAAANIRVPEKRDERVRTPASAGAHGVRQIRIVEFDTKTGAAKSIGR